MTGWIVALLMGAVLAVLGMRADVDIIGAHESAARVRQVARGARAGRGAARPHPAGAERVRVYVVVSGLTPARRRALEAAGLAIELPAPGTPAARWHGGELVQGLVAPAAVDALERLPFVRRVEAPGLRWTNAGAVATAGDRVLGTDVARAVLATDGVGVAVGVISDGADGAVASRASGDLPAVEQLPLAGVTPGRGSEGTALLEIVHDTAPGARLLFAAPGTSAEMVAAIDGLAAAGAQVIVDDLVFTDEPKFEDGPIARAAQRFVQAGGVYVTAAGNYARTHYFAPYRAGDGTTLGGLDYRALHRFADSDFGNSLRIPAGSEVIVVLQWNDEVGRAGNDFDLLLARAASGADLLLAAGTEAQDGNGTPLEALRWLNTTGARVDAYVAIGEYARRSDPGALRLNLVLFSRDPLRLQYVTPRESIFGHAAADDVLSVAAADASSPDVVEDFSSNGPASIFFPVTVVRNVPLLTGVDGVTTAIGRRGEFADPFRGTSAAAPHVAGCAALLRAAGVPAATVRSAMLATAVDLEPVGFDLAAGNGRLDCAAAARLALGNAHAPVVHRVAGGFAASGAVAVEIAGEDADGDVRSVVVRLLDRAGDEIARTTADVSAGGTAFGVTVTAQGAALARVRAVSARARDATRLESVEVGASVACPGDASLGDALCALGDLRDGVAVLPGRRARRLERTAEQATTALARAGAAIDAGQRRRARRALGRAQARLGKLIRLVAARSVDPELRRLVTDMGRQLRTRVIGLRTQL